MTSLSTNFSTTFLPKFRRPSMAMILVIVSQLPIVALVLRALGTSWAYPDLLPSGIAGSFGDVMSTGRIWSSGLTSLTLAVTTGIVAALAGAVIARGVIGASPNARRLATMLMFFPVIAPPVALGVGVQVLLLRAGLGSTWAGVCLAHLLPAVGYVSLYFIGALSLDDTTRDEAARTLGASAWTTWWRVTVPAMRRRFAEAMVLGALVSWGQLALTLLVGGGVVRTMPVEILAIIRSGDDHVAAIASLVLTIPPLLALSVLRHGANRVYSDG